MCVAFWTINHPTYALILAANRDEFLSRPTIPTTWHNFEQEVEIGEGSVLSGRDAMAGGTWLGVNKNGDVAVLTNITELAGKYASSRGELASNFLRPETSTHPRSDSTHLEQYVSSIISQQRTFAGFNLLLLSPSSSTSESKVQYTGTVTTNSGGGGTITSRPLASQECTCGGVSNADDSAHAHETNIDWPKVKLGKELFAEIASKEWGDTDLVETLCEMMSTENPSPPTTRFELRTTISVRPVPVQPKAWTKPVEPSASGSAQNSTSVPTETSHPAAPLPASTHTAPALTSQAIDYYGTRLTTIILVGRDGHATFVERDIWSVGEDGGLLRKGKESERRFEFDIKT
ncbi:DUF833-domain-containing protein [Ceratobasidium sp. AG-I]|nr:DUF833-domain-containing protein [Ceratobasidium sp. AG-I]